MFPTPQENAQRMLDRLPRPPHELPSNDPMRALADMLGEQSRVDDLEDQIGSLESEISDCGKAADDLVEQRKEIREWLVALRVSIRTAEDSAEDDQSTLRALLKDLRELEQKLAEAVKE